MKEKTNHIARMLLNNNGIDVSKYEEEFLKKSLLKRITETHCDSEEAYISFLEKNASEGVLLLDSLQISYSTFFRNSLTFAVLERIILPMLIQKKSNNKKKEIRIWSTACAAGQESYSLAMLMEELKKSCRDEITYRIFATDQSETLINEAIKGEYSTAALNNLSMIRVNEWFKIKGESCTIKPALKKHIDFSVFNLFNAQLSCPPVSIFGDFDLIICANLLFYYKPEFRKIILDKITNCLAIGGYMMTGEAEREIFMKYNYNEVFSQSAIFEKLKEKIRRERE